MPDPRELLAVARLLLDAPPEGSASDVRLRRAVSTAYYAVFHTVLQAAAERFVGPDLANRQAFGLIYRGFDHTRIKRVCEALQGSTLNARYQDALGRRSVSHEMRDFAGTFPDLQELRHRADYDPGTTFLPSDVAGVVEAAEEAMKAFGEAPADERTDVLALMLVGARG